jgi:hypothetical protein
MLGSFGIECPLINFSSLDSAETEKFQETPFQSFARLQPFPGGTLLVR